MSDNLSAGANRPTYRFWVLAAFLALVFLLGGSSRADVPSLLVVRPAAAVVAFVGIHSLTKAQIADHRFTFVMIGAAALLIMIHLVPLPPEVWHSLPGRTLVADIDRALGATDRWRPISLAPAATLNALFAMLPPVAVLLLAVQLRANEHRYLIRLLLAVAAVTCGIGLLQLAGIRAANFYGSEEDGVAFATGLFANQNHQATFLAITLPLIIAFASRTSSKSTQFPIRPIATAFTISLVLAVVVGTQSRAGIALALVGLASAASVYPKQGPTSPRRRPAVENSRSWSRPLLIGGLAVVAGLLVLLLQRAQIISRFTHGNPLDDFRFQVWRPIANMVFTYMPVGSGIGSFVQIYQVQEPVALLRSEYLNHAHNDLLEAALTGGAPALLLILVAVSGWIWRTLAIRRRIDAVAPRSPAPIRLEVLGCITTFILALASLTDYPLRTPSLACLLILAAVWMQIDSTASASASSRKGK